MKLLPPGIVTYKRTPTFTEATVPSGLLANHSTKQGTWGQIVVESGQLTYVITEPGLEEEIRLTEVQRGVVAPGERHHVRVDGAVSFYVEFLR